MMNVLRIYALGLLAVFLSIGKVHALPEADSKAPVTINADDLEIIQNERKAIFTGGVEAQQGSMKLFSNRMTVFYKGEGEPSANPGGIGGLDRILVEGNVRLLTAEESATGQRGLYDASNEKLYLYGDVVLRRGENVLNGSKLEYNMATGASMLSGGVNGAAPQSSGRVRAVFTPAKEEDNQE